jgi:hypothetical protein
MYDLTVLSVYVFRGTRWRSWLKHCATSRKVAGSISYGVFEIYRCLNPSCRTMALGSTQPLTEMSTFIFHEGQRRPVPRADNLTIFMCPVSKIRGASTSWSLRGVSGPAEGQLYLAYVVVYK